MHIDSFGRDKFATATFVSESTSNLAQVGKNMFPFWLGYIGVHFYVLERSGLNMRGKIAKCIGLIFA